MTSFLSARCPNCKAPLPCVETPVVAPHTGAVLTWLIDVHRGRWQSAQEALRWALREGVIRHE